MSQNIPSSLPSFHQGRPLSSEEQARQEQYRSTSLPPISQLVSPQRSSSVERSSRDMADYSITHRLRGEFYREGDVLELQHRPNTAPVVGTVTRNLRQVGNLVVRLEKSPHDEIRVDYRDWYKVEVLEPQRLAFPPFPRTVQELASSRSAQPPMSATDVVDSSTIDTAAQGQPAPPVPSVPLDTAAMIASASATSPTQGPSAALMSPVPLDNTSPIASASSNTAVAPNDTPPPAYASGAAPQPIRPTFTTITIHTAKCDICNHHNVDTLQRCNACGWSVCSRCLGDNPQRVTNHNCMGSTSILGSTSSYTGFNLPVPTRGPSLASLSRAKRGKRGGRAAKRGGRGGNTASTKEGKKPEAPSVNQEAKGDGDGRGNTREDAMEIDDDEEEPAAHAQGKSQTTGRRLIRGDHRKRAEAEEKQRDAAKTPKSAEKGKGKKRAIEDVETEDEALHGAAIEMDVATVVEDAAGRPFSPRSSAAAAAFGDARERRRGLEDLAAAELLLGIRAGHGDHVRKLRRMELEVAAERREREQWERMEYDRHRNWDPAVHGPHATMMASGPAEARTADPAGLRLPTTARQMRVDRRGPVHGGRQGGQGGRASLREMDILELQVANPGARQATTTTHSATNEQVQSSLAINDSHSAAATTPVPADSPAPPS